MNQIYSSISRTKLRLLCLVGVEKDLEISSRNLSSERKLLNSRKTFFEENPTSMNKIVLQRAQDELK